MLLWFGCALVLLLLVPQNAVSLHASVPSWRSHRQSTGVASNQPPACPDGTQPPLGWLALGCTGNTALCAAAWDALGTINFNLGNTSTDGRVPDRAMAPLLNIISTVCGAVPQHGYGSGDAGGDQGDVGDSTLHKDLRKPETSDTDRMADLSSRSYTSPSSTMRLSNRTATIGTAESEEQQQRQRLRKRRDAVLPRQDPDNHRFQDCSFEHFIDGSCAGDENEERDAILTLKMDNHHACEMVKCLRNGTCLFTTKKVADLTITGTVAHKELNCLLELPDWSKVRSLNLSSLNLPTFHLSKVRQMTSLQAFNLSSNKMTRLEGTPGSSLLAILDLRANRLPDLPQNLIQASAALTELNLNGNQIEDVPPSSFDTNGNLRSLDLGSNRLRSFPPKAFLGLSALQELKLDDNNIGHLPQRVFRGLPALLKLDLVHNTLSSLAENPLEELGKLQHLDLSQNPLSEGLPEHLLRNQQSLAAFFCQETQLTALPSRFFAATPMLSDLDLSRNKISKLLPEHLYGLSGLQRLDLDANKLKDLPHALFHGMTSLRMLSVEHNNIRELPPTLLRQQTALEWLSFDDNAITSIPAGLLLNQMLLEHLDLANNYIAHFPRGFFANVTGLVRLHAGNNRLTHFAADLPRLKALYLNDNPIQSLLKVSQLQNLEVLVLINHRIPEVKFSDILSLKQLAELAVEAHPEAKSRFVFNSNEYNSTELEAIRRHVSHISSLNLRNMEIDSSLEPFRNLSSIKRFRFGWPGVDDSFPLDNAYSVLANEVEDLTISRTAITELDIPDRFRFHSLNLQDNRQLVKVSMSQRLQRLNVSGCSRLLQISSPQIRSIDISGTNMSGHHKFCDNLGTDVFFARNLLNKELRATGSVTQFLRRCLQYAHVIDLTGNSWLRNLDDLLEATQDPIVLSDRTVTRVTDNHTYVQRVSLPAFTTQFTPVVCQLDLGIDRVQIQSSGDSTSELTYIFKCTCATGYHDEGSTCKRDKPAIVEIAVGSVFGLLALQALVYGVVRWYKSRVVSLRKDHALNKQLLSERDAEVLALKAVWEIDYDQLHLLQRIAAGAYGDVWEGEWDELSVAVKVLKQSMRLFDETTIAEFEKEVEFLQRTRHPHLVRFFGAGTAPDGCPFLVLEYVPLGSLQALLKRDFEQVFVKFRNKRASAGEEDAQAGVQVEEDNELLVVTPHVATGGEKVPDTVWALKQRLARDVACGMAFIHSLGKFHRDLKSGNVLVSGRLRAKITDFGTIRQRLSAEPLHNEAAQGDIRYSQRLRTTTMSMFATVGVGTPLYMAPEVIMGNAYGAKADVFSFGVLLWEIAVQQTPDLIEQEDPNFCGAMMIKLSRLLQNGKRLAFSGAAEHTVGAWYQQLTYECMALEPRERPSFEQLMRRLSSA